MSSTSFEQRNLNTVKKPEEVRSSESGGLSTQVKKLRSAPKQDPIKSVEKNQRNTSAFNNPLDSRDPTFGENQLL